MNVLLEKVPLTAPPKKTKDVSLIAALSNVAMGRGPSPLVTTVSNTFTPQHDDRNNKIEKIAFIIVQIFANEIGET